MTEMRDVINFVGFWRSPPLQCSPPLTRQYLTIFMIVRGGGALSFVGFWRPPPQTPQYLTILMTERGGGAIIICRILALPNDPPPPDDTILNYLNDRERGAPLCRILTPPSLQCPPPYEFKILYYLNDRDEGLLFFKDFGAL